MSCELRRGHSFGVCLVKVEAVGEKVLTRVEGGTENNRRESLRGKTPTLALLTAAKDAHHGPARREKQDTGYCHCHISLSRCHRHLLFP